MPEPDVIKPTQVNVDTVASGKPVLPIDRIRIFSSDEWEEFVLEWAHSLQDKYSSVERCGGSGDMGRDVIGISDNGDWDNYQCKHYDHPLYPSDIWLELGKIVYYTYTGEYTYPKKYYFVAPQGAGTSLSNLLRKPEDLRLQLLEEWPSKCADKIAIDPVPLDEKLRVYINSLDFSIFGSLPPLHLIEDHARTRWHVPRFGGGLGTRPTPPEPPTNPSTEEATYVRALLDAYEDHLNVDVEDPSELPDLNEGIAGHFKDSRLEFYSAESLRTITRETLPAGIYESLQDEVFDGIRDDIRARHPDAYERVLRVVRTARMLQMTSSPLTTHLTIRDRGGICHQLVNDERFTWRT